MIKTYRKLLKIIILIIYIKINVIGKVTPNVNIYRIDPTLCVLLNIERQWTIERASVPEDTIHKTICMAKSHILLKVTLFLLNTVDLNWTVDKHS